MISWLILTALAATPGDHWPGFRGDGTSVSAAVQLPIEWSDSQHVAWRVSIPGYGQSSPVVWGNLVFVTSTDGAEKQRLLVSAFETTTGKLAWTKEFAATQTVAKVSDYVSRGAPTPIVDADRIYAFFESGDLVALTHTGETVWQRSLVKEYGEFQGNHGVGASMAATPDSLIVLVDHSGPSYLLAINKTDGQNRWKADRDPKVSWSSPLVRTRGDAWEIVISSSGFIDCYSADTGTRLWWVSGLDGNTVASPSLANDLILVGSSKTNQNLAVTTGGSGDVSEQAVKWRSAEATSSFGSPLVSDGVAYYVNRAGVLFALDALSGETLWNERLADACWASPLAVEGRIYCFTKGGTTIVYQGGRDKVRLAENTLATDDRVYGVAAVNGAFFVREGSRLTRLSTTR